MKIIIADGDKHNRKETEMSIEDYKATSQEMDKVWKKFVNLTPHDVTVAWKNELGAEAIMSIPPEGKPCRVETKYGNPESIGGIPIVPVSHGEIKDLPPPEEGKIFIVSLMVLDQVEGRPDVVAPDTGATCVRENGQIKHVTRFLRKP